MSARYHAMTELLELFPNNPVILEAAIKTEDHINTVARNGGKIMVSISGGSDSERKSVRRSAGANPLVSLGIATTTMQLLRSTGG